MKIPIGRGYTIDPSRKEITAWPCPVCGHWAGSPAALDRHHKRKHTKTKK